jgi:hypothetical protein
MPMDVATRLGLKRSRIAIATRRGEKCSVSARGVVNLPHDIPYGETAWAQHQVSVLRIDGAR